MTDSHLGGEDNVNVNKTNNDHSSTSTSSKKRKKEAERDKVDNDNDDNNNDNNNNVDNFLSAMTWANLSSHDIAGRCECDECGVATSTRFRRIKKTPSSSNDVDDNDDDDNNEEDVDVNVDVASSSGTGSGFRKTSTSMIPEAIAAAIAEYKLQRRSFLQFQQSRSLVKRYGAVSVWEWTLPASAEPLIEFGSSHRLIWIRHLPSQGVLQSIGKGIVGSSAEEEGRTALQNWTSGTVVLVKSNGGRAVGYVHNHTVKSQDNTNDDDSNNNNNKNTLEVGGGGRYATLVIAKIPVDLFKPDISTSNDAYATTTTGAAGSLTTATESLVSAAAAVTVAAPPDWFVQLCDICRPLLHSLPSSSSSSIIHDSDDHHVNNKEPLIETVGNQEAERIKMALAPS